MVYEIAGLKVEMEPKYGRLTSQSAAYASSGTPVMRLTPDPADLAQVALETPSPEEQEYICCSAAFCRELIGHGRLFLHASAVVHEGAAYLFSAPSGTGKSTHTALWRITPAVLPRCPVCPRKSERSPTVWMPWATPPLPWARALPSALPL